MYVGRQGRGWGGMVFQTLLDYAVSSGQAEETIYGPLRARGVRTDALGDLEEPNLPPVPGVKAVL
jgi:hypothetical protein